MTEKGFRKTGFTKYIISLLVILFIAALMLYASGSSRDFEEVSRSVETTLDRDSLAEQPPAALKKNMGLNAADYAGVMYYTAQSSISSEEVMLLCVKDNDQIQEVTQCIEQRLEERTRDFDGYAPSEVKLLKDAVISVRGKYIFLAVSPKADEYLSVFSSSL